ncbi:MAG: hypothetical protein ACXVXZ_13820 [Mycobacteriaceae bacterium]
MVAARAGTKAQDGLWDLPAEIAEHVVRGTGPFGAFNPIGVRT